MPTPPPCGGDRRYFSELPVVVVIVCNLPLCILLQSSNKPYGAHMYRTKSPPPTLEVGGGAGGG